MVPGKPGIGNKKISIRSKERQTRGQVSKRGRNGKETVKQGNRLFCDKKSKTWGEKGF